MLFLENPTNSRCGQGSDPTGDFPCKIFDPDLMALAMPDNDGDVPQKFGQRRRVQGGRHDQQTQILFDLTQIQTEGQGQVGVEGSFMEFVKDDQPHAA